MPACCARLRPAASGRLEITTEMWAFNRRESMASMMACRFDPRPEIRTPSRLENGSDVFFGPAIRVLLLPARPHATPGTIPRRLHLSLMNRAAKRFCLHEVRVCRLFDAEAQSPFSAPLRLCVDGW